MAQCNKLNLKVRYDGDPDCCKKKQKKTLHWIKLRARVREGWCSGNTSNPIKMADSQGFVLQPTSQLYAGLVGTPSSCCLSSTPTMLACLRMVRPLLKSTQPLPGCWVITGVGCNTSCGCFPSLSWSISICFYFLWQRSKGFWFFMSCGQDKGRT
jgi:hypothetical protein